MKRPERAPEPLTCWCCGAMAPAPGEGGMIVPNCPNGCGWSAGCEASHPRQHEDAPRVAAGMGLGDGR